MSDQLPHNDPDAIRARKIGEAREQGRALSDMDDLLLTYKARREEAYAPDADRKEKCWDQIAASTQNFQPEKKANVTRLFSARALRWAAAAVLVIGLIFSVFYLQNGQGPKLLASSGGSIKTVKLKDGSVIKLRPHTKFYRIKNEASLKLYKLKGEGFFNIAHNPQRTFSVQTSTGSVSVLGTQFNLSSWGKKLRVYLKKGSVEVKALDSDSSVVIKPGESATVSDPKARPKVSRDSVDTFTDWLQQKIIFHNRPARDVADELQQQFDITITLPSRVADQRISGRLSAQRQIDALDDLALVLNGSFKKKSDHHYVFTFNQ